MKSRHSNYKKNRPCSAFYHLHSKPQLSKIKKKEEKFSSQSFKYLTWKEIPQNQQLSQLYQRRLKLKASIQILHQQQLELITSVSQLKNFYKQLVKVQGQVRSFLCDKKSKKIIDQQLMRLQYLKKNIKTRKTLHQQKSELDKCKEIIQNFNMSKQQQEITKMNQINITLISQLNILKRSNQVMNNRIKNNTFQYQFQSVWDQDLEDYNYQNQLKHQLKIYASNQERLAQRERQVQKLTKAINQKNTVISQVETQISRLKQIRNAINEKQMLRKEQNQKIAQLKTKEQELKTKIGQMQKSLQAQYKLKSQQRQKLIDKKDQQQKQKKSIFEDINKQRQGQQQISQKYKNLLKSRNKKYEQQLT